MNKYGIKALQFIQDNKLDEVQKQINQSIQLSKEEQNEEDLYELALSFFNIGFLKEALFIAEQGKDYFGYDEWYILIAEIKIDNDEVDEALEILLSISKESNMYVSALLTMADIYQLQQLYDVALYKLDLAKAIVNDEPMIDLGRAQLYYLMGEYSPALSIYEKLLDHMDMDQVVLYKHMAKVLIALGEFENAITYLDKLQQDEHDSDSLFTLALSYYQIEEYNRAISNFQQLLLLDPDYQSANYYLAQSYLKVQQLEKARALLEKAIEDNPYDEKCYMVLFNIYMQVDKEKLINLFEKVSDYLSDNISLMLLYVQYLSSIENYEKIISFLLTKIEEDYEERAFYWELAKAYRQLEQDDSARHYYQLAEQLYENDYQFNRDYAEYLQEIGDLIHRQIIINKFKK